MQPSASSIFDYLFFFPCVCVSVCVSQVQVRTAAITCLNAWTDEVPVNTLFEQDLVAGSLATENPNLRTEVLAMNSTIIILVLLYRAYACHMSTFVFH